MTYYLMLTTGSTELRQAIQNGSLLEIQARKWFVFISNFSQLAFLTMLHFLPTCQQFI